VLHFAGDPAALLATVRPSGRFVSTLLMSPQQLPTEDATVISIYANPDTATLARCAHNRAEDVTRVHLQRTYTLDELPTALTDFAGGTLGKLAIITA
jgi:NADPH2:quinone reductase